MYRDSILRTVRAPRLLHDVTLELTYHCNLDCFFCSNDREQSGFVSRWGVLTPAELHSRFDVYSEQYIQTIGVEARLVIIALGKRHV